MPHLYYLNLTVHLVAAMLWLGGMFFLGLVGAVHDFALGPRASVADPASPAAAVLRRRASLIARANAVLGVLLVAAALKLARGG